MAGCQRNDSEFAGRGKFPRGRLTEKVFSRFETRQISPWQADQEVRQVSLDKARFRERGRSRPSMAFATFGLPVHHGRSIETADGRLPEKVLRRFVTRQLPHGRLTEKVFSRFETRQPPHGRLSEE